MVGASGGFVLHKDLDCRKFIRYYCYCYLGNTSFLPWQVRHKKRSDASFRFLPKAILFIFMLCILMNNKDLFDLI